jgi:hypothetical protein
MNIAEIRAQLDAITSMDATYRETKFTEIEQSMETLRGKFNEASVFLSSYDIQKSMEASHTSLIST